MRLFQLLPIIGAAISFTTIGALADSGYETLRGKVVAGTTDSAIGDYGFLNDTAAARKIFGSCKMGDICEIEGRALNGTIVDVRSARTVPSGPPPSDAVYDDRNACLYGSMEGDRLSDDQRAASCDAWAKLEDQALEAGYCWNQLAAEYRACSAD